MDAEALVESVTSRRERDFFFEKEWARVFQEDCLDAAERSFEEKMVRELQELISMCDDLGSVEEPPKVLELTKELGKNQEVEKALNDLWVIRSGFQEVEALREMGSLDQALVSLQTVGAKLQAFKYRGNLADELESEIERTQKGIMSQVDTIWNESITFDHGMILREDELLPLSDVYEIVQHADANKPQTRREVLLQNIEKHVVDPVLNLQVKGASADEKKLQFEMGKPDLRTLRPVLETTVDFLTSITWFSESIVKRFSSMIVNKLTTKTLPELFPDDNLERFEMELKEFVMFEEHLKEIGWTKSNDLRNWIMTFQKEWVKHRKLHYLDRIRAEIHDMEVITVEEEPEVPEAEDWNNWDDNWDDDDEDKPNNWDKWDDGDEGGAKPTMKFKGTTNVSKLLNIFRDFAKEMKDEAVVTSNVGELVALFRALSPTIYQSGLIQYNDISLLSKQMPLYVPEYDRQKLHQHGERCFNEVVDTQQIELMQRIRIANGFQNCTVHTAKCRESVAASCKLIITCHGEWGQDTTLPVVCKMVAALVETLVSSIMASVEAQEDISEAECNELAELFKQVSDLNALFQDPQNQTDATNIAAVYIKSWIKFQYFGEILQSSLVDILYLYNTNALIDFSKTELIGLVRALFAESERRQRAINDILRGPRPEDAE